MKKKFRNLTDLCQEIEQLGQRSNEQQSAIKQRFRSTHSAMETIRSLSFVIGKKRSTQISKILKDPVVETSKYLLPLVFKKTIFRNSDFLTKSLVGVIAKNAARFISMNRLGQWTINLERSFKKRGVTNA